MGRLSGVVVAFCLAAGGLGAWALTPPRPLQPPVGWEERTLPGFEPSLESVLVRQPHINDDQIREAWKKWGPEAVEGFWRLFNDPAWKDFRHAILRILFVSPHPEARARLEQEAGKLAAGEASAIAENERFPFIQLVSMYFKDCLSLLQEFAKSPSENVRMAAGYGLARLATPDSLAAAREVMSTLDPGNRQSLSGMIKAAEGNQRAKELMIK